MSAKVLIVDDHKLFAEAIRSTLEARGYTIEGVAMTGREALEMIRFMQPDLALLDLGLPDINGIEVGKKILQMYPTTKVMIVTAINEPDALKEVLDAGFSGYLTKETPVQQFVTAVESALEGHAVFPHRLARAATAGFRSEEERDASLRVRQLTPRENEVLGLLVEGISSEEMASRLSVSPNTVRTHVQNVLTKLGARSRLEAATFAVRYGVIQMGGWRNRGSA